MIIIDRNGSTESLRAAVGARCAGDQGLFWPYHEWLFANQKGENQGHFSDAFLKAIAVAVGVPDMEKWAACTKDQAVADAAEAEKAEGTQRGVNGTPTLFVNGENVGFPAYLDLKAKIDAIVAGS
jgi:protein-disulfide isomerase